MYELSIVTDNGLVTEFYDTFALALCHGSRFEKLLGTFITGWRKRDYYISVRMEGSIFIKPTLGEENERPSRFASAY